ncbi:MAG: hypothetical protein Q4F41_00255 [Eubacteriales bacterium]|nr:hypothetical protein [Eubacteriales bacterium]
MKKIKSLNRYQKGVLIFMVAMTLVFAVVYSMTISQAGFEYKNTILVPSQENGSTVYSGKIQGQQAHFTVSEDKTVVFQHGDKTYGPYTAKEDPTAIPKDTETAEYMTGVELRQGEEILFRGGVFETGDSFWLYNEDGTLDNFGLSYVTIDGIERDENGNVIDPVEPSAYTILEVMNDPPLTHKGEWFAWFGAMFICVLNALSVLFADELFRWNVAFRIRNVDHAEPSDWEIAWRYIGWTVVAIIALVLFVMGLQ